MSQASEKLAALVQQFTEDHDKFEDKGNSSAGTRARKTLQEIKKACGEIRTEIQEAKNAGKKAA